MNSFAIVSLILQTLKAKAKAGVTTIALDSIAEKIIEEQGGTSCNKGYFPKDDIAKLPENRRPKTPFPTALVVNVNSTIAHGIPREYKLRNGNIVSFDIGVEKDGVCADAAFTMGIGKIASKDERLIRYAYGALQEGIKQVKAGVNVKEISRAIEIYVVRRGYVVNENFAGHGINSVMHAKPDIPNYTHRGQPDYFLKEDEQICLEPMLTFQDRFGMITNNGWSWVTRDGKNSAFFETQLSVTKDGHRQLIEIPPPDQERSN